MSGMIVMVNISAFKAILLCWIISSGVSTEYVFRACVAVMFVVVFFGYEICSRVQILKNGSLEMTKNNVSSFSRNSA